jgi:small subunit ribosomal protein S1
MPEAAPASSTNGAADAEATPAEAQATPAEGDEASATADEGAATVADEAVAESDATADEAAAESDATADEAAAPDEADATADEAAAEEPPTEAVTTDAAPEEAAPEATADEAATDAEEAVATTAQAQGDDATADDAASDADAAASDEAAPGAAASADEPEAAAAETVDDGSGAPADEADALAAEAEDAPPAADSDEADEADTDAVDAAPEAATEAERAPVAVAVDTRPEPTTMEELLAEQSTEIRSLKHGDVVEGNVVRIDKDEILVDIGAKSEGVVSNRELYGRNAESQPQLNIGDTVLVYVLQPESNEGHAVLSLRRAGLERKWRSMQEQLDAGVIIEAPVIDHNKGGLIVDCGIRGFVPISQIVDFPRRPQNEQPRDAAQEIAEKLQPYVGRKLRLKILEVNRKANRLILSEKVALYEERREKRDELFSSLKVGQQVKGTVRSIAPFGVFVDLGGIDGLVHKSELSWNKVNNPESGYRVGEEVEAEVIDINHERGRISLSIRRLQPDPWHSTVADLKVGDIIEGTVTKIVNFGAFVRVREGLEGLIHISELSQQRVAHPGDVVHEGQKLNLKVISLDSERHRLGLSLKQAEETAPARPAVTEGSGAPRERERRSGGRTERGGFDASQAVQEPEGGIDNTLAAAFAQVRQQMAEQESAASETPADDTVEPTSAEADTADTAEASAEADTAEGDTAEADTADTAEAPAAEETAGEPTSTEEPADTEASASEETATDSTSTDEAAASDQAATDEAPAADETSTDGATAAAESSDETSDAEETAAEATSAGDAPAAEDISTEEAAEPETPAETSSDETSADEGSAPEETSSDETSTDEGSAPEETSTDEAPGADDTEATSEEDPDRTTAG